MNISETFSTDTTYLFEQGLISSSTLMAEFDIDYKEEMKHMKEERDMHQEFFATYLNQYKTDESNRFFSEEDIKKVQKQIREVNNDPNMTVVTSSHISNDDFIDEFAKASIKALGLPAEFLVGENNKFSKSKKGNKSSNSECVEGVLEQTLEDNSNRIFEYNDVINYFEGRYRDEQRN